MFFTEEAVAPVGARIAQTRLAGLARGGGLAGASEAAHKDGLTHLLRVGPMGGVPGASKLVQVLCLDPVYRGDVMTLGIRWEATGVTGAMFPLMDADLWVSPAGEGGSLLTMKGSYRPPLGRLGTQLDRVLLNRVATATIRALLRTLADTVSSPAPQWTTGESRLPSALPMRQLTEPDPETPSQDRAPA